MRHVLIIVNESKLNFTLISDYKVKKVTYITVSVLERQQSQKLKQTATENIDRKVNINLNKKAVL